METLEQSWTLRDAATVFNHEKEEGSEEALKGGEIEASQWWLEHISSINGEQNAQCFKFNGLKSLSTKLKKIKEINL